MMKFKKGLIKNSLFRGGSIPLSNLDIKGYNPDKGNPKSLVTVGLAKEYLKECITYTSNKPVENNIGGIIKGMEFYNTPIVDLLDKIFKGNSFRPLFKVSFTVVNPTNKIGAFPLFTVKGRGKGIGLISIVYNHEEVEVIQYNKEERYTHLSLNERGTYQVDLEFDSLVESIEFEEDENRQWYVKDVVYPSIFESTQEVTKLEVKGGLENDRDEVKELTVLGDNKLELEKFDISTYNTDLTDDHSLLTVEALKQLIEDYLYYENHESFNFPIGNVVNTLKGKFKLNDVFYNILYGSSTYDIDITLKVTNNTDAPQEVCLFNLLTLDKSVSGRVEYSNKESDLVYFPSQDSVDKLNQLLKYEEGIGDSNTEGIYEGLSLYQPFYKEFPSGEHTVRILLSKGVRNLVFFDKTTADNYYITEFIHFKVNSLNYLDSTFIHLPRVTFHPDFTLESTTLEVINNNFNGIGGEDNPINLSKNLFKSLPKLKKAIGVFRNSYLERVPKGLFDNNLELENVDYLFYKSKIGGNPLGEIHVNAYLDLVENKDEDIIIPRSLFWKSYKLKSAKHLFSGMEYQLGSIEGKPIPFLLRREFLEGGKSLGEVHLLEDILDSNFNYMVDKERIDTKKVVMKLEDNFKRV